jgi:hypothetical protein
MERTTRRWDIVRMSTTATQTKSNRISPRWFALPVVREIPAPPAQVGSGW